MIFVTDHAVLRYLERKYGIDVAAIKDEILALPGLVMAGEAGARTVAIDGLTYTFRNSYLTSVVPGSNGAHAGRLASQHKRGRRPKMRSRLKGEQRRPSPRNEGHFDESDG